MNQSVSIKTPLKIQIPLGLFFAVLNMTLHFLNNFNPIPLYADTLFTVSAAFFGLTSGLICAVLSHVLFLIVNHLETVTLFWMICSISLVFIIRIYLKKRKVIEAVDIILLIFLVALILSFEGAIIFMFLNALAHYKEDSQIRFMYTFLSSSNIPTFVSALLPRIPVNILDKGICVPLGYLCYKGVGKIPLVSASQEIPN